MLQVENLSVNIDQKQIVKNMTLDFKLWKNYCILGKNWSWKSSLAMSIMWHPKYSIENGNIYVDWESIKNLQPNQRANMGIFLAFQHIPEIKGIKIFEFLRSIYDIKNQGKTSFLAFKKIIEPILIEIGLDKEFLRRDLNVGFSWWERRKLEILQLKLLKPKYIFLDEIDSWLDVDALKTVSEMIKWLNSQDNCFIVITHMFKILEYLPIDHVYVLRDWELAKTWDQKLIQDIMENGFEFI